ncbi:MAG: MgtC/SapB family protein [Candidatus Vogelbacteria bacterium]|nr:MgtC/SapB family protein [Candidatus Vogelbacteria bacterium]
MININDFLVRFLIALVIGAVMGVERESAGKEAGIRTSMLVSAGSAVFAVIALSLPYLVAAQTPQILLPLLASGSYFGVIGNIVSGIGFLGAGIILKTEQHVHGLTTAAMIWTSSAVGILIGVGMTNFGIIVGLALPVLLYILRTVGLIDSIRPSER